MEKERTPLVKKPQNRRTPKQIQVLWCLFWLCKPCFSPFLLVNMLTFWEEKKSVFGHYNIGFWINQFLGRQRQKDLLWLAAGPKLKNEKLLSFSLSSFFFFFFFFVSVWEMTKEYWYSLFPCIDQSALTLINSCNLIWTFFFFLQHVARRLNFWPVGRNTSQLSHTLVGLFISFFIIFFMTFLKKNSKYSSFGIHILILFFLNSIDSFTIKKKNQ